MHHCFDFGKDIAMSLPKATFVAPLALFWMTTTTQTTMMTIVAAIDHQTPSPYISNLPSLPFVTGRGKEGSPSSSCFIEDIRTENTAISNISSQKSKVPDKWRRRNAEKSSPTKPSPPPPPSPIHHHHLSTTVPNQPRLWKLSHQHRQRNKRQVPSKQSNQQRSPWH